MTIDHRVAASVTDLRAVRDGKAKLLLERRDNLGTQWAQALSHHAPGADDLAYAIALVENAISENHPAVFDQHFSEWVVRDAAQLHSPGTASGFCPLCDLAYGNPDAA